MVENNNEERNSLIWCLMAGFGISGWVVASWRNHLLKHEKEKHSLEMKHLKQANGRCSDWREKIITERSEENPAQPLTRE